MEVRGKEEHMNQQLTEIDLFVAKEFRFCTNRARGEDVLVGQDYSTLLIHLSQLHI